MVTKAQEKAAWQWGSDNPKTAAAIFGVVGGIIGWVLTAAHVLPRLW